MASQFTEKAPEQETPHRQIRALYDEETITVYQAYSAEIAEPAVKAQRLNASPKFSGTRMTWIKTSWCWMMYRSGYSYKDPHQERILALRMKHEHFRALLVQAVVTDDLVGAMSSEEKAKGVRVQWDPERSVKIGALGYRSIQIGISGKVSQLWAEEWVVRIEDVTEMARGMKMVLDEEPEAGVEELVRRGLMPRERVYEVPEELRRILRMEEYGRCGLVCGHGSVDAMFMKQ